MSDDLDVDSLINKADAFFEAKKDVDTLKRYLDAVSGSNVSMGNFNTKQKKALMKIRGIDKLYLEPCDEIDEEDNNCKKIVKMAVEVSKSDSYGLDMLKSMLMGKVRLKEDGDTILNSDSEKNKDGDSENE